MANEVEASELAIAKEGLGSEEISQNQTSPAEAVSIGGTGAEGSSENVEELKFDTVIESGVMANRNEKQDSELTVIQETVTDKVTELIESPTVKSGDSEIVEKPDVKTVNEDNKESVTEANPESSPEPAEAGQAKPAVELMAASEAVESDKPLGTGESNPTDEHKPEPVVNEKAVGVDESEPADELVPGAEPVENEKAVNIDEPNPSDELVPGAEGVASNKQLEADELKLADEPKPEPVVNEKAVGIDESKASDEKVPGAEAVPSGKPSEIDELKAKPEAVEIEKAVEIDESKPANVLISGSAAVASGKPSETDELKTSDELVPGAEGVESDKPFEAGESKPSDELAPEPESVANDKAVEIDESKAADEQMPGPELAPDDEQSPGLKPESGAELQPGHEPGQSDVLSQGPEQQPGDELSQVIEPEQGDELQSGPEPEQSDELSQGLEMVPGDDEMASPDAEPDSEDEEKEVEQDVDDNEEKVEKPLDDDQDRRNPQYIPKGGAFYEHDNRTSLEDVENKDPQDNEKKKKSWKESKDSEEWLHDCYDEIEQQPKSTAEIIKTYGYDIRCDDAPPRARRRRKYGRGPEKYDRNWEDEQAYQSKPNNIGRRGKKKLFGKDEFPPLPSQKLDSTVSKPVQRSSMRKREEGGSRSVNVKLNGNEKSPAAYQGGRSSYSGNHNSLHSFNSNRKSYGGMNRKLNDNDIKPFRNDDSRWKGPFKHGRQDDYPKPIKTQPVRHSDPSFRRSAETNKNSTKEPHISHITDGINQMSFMNKHTDLRDVRLKGAGPEENKMNEQEVDNPANRQNPKRYSKIRKGFTGIFPPEEVPELDQSDIHKIQQEQQKSQHLNMTQPLNMQNVIKRYAGTYGNLSNCVSDFVPGNSSYLQARPIISGIPQQALSPQGIHQQALSPQGIPQQALSPQVPGMPPIELQQNPLGQPNFVPQPMYVDPHFTSDVMGPFSGYSPYSGNQTGEVYQPSRGITYYNTECQTSGQKRPPPRRQNAAIPIVPPPE